MTCGNVGHGSFRVVRLVPVATGRLRQSVPYFSHGRQSLGDLRPSSECVDPLPHLVLTTVQTRRVHPVEYRDAVSSPCGHPCRRGRSDLGDCGTGFAASAVSRRNRMSTTVTLAGNLAEDPELLYTHDQKPFVSCMVLVNRRIQNDAGESDGERWPDFNTGQAGFQTQETASSRAGCWATSGRALPRSRLPHRPSRIGKSPAPSVTFSRSTAAGCAARSASPVKPSSRLGSPARRMKPGPAHERAAAEQGPLGRGAGLSRGVPARRKPRRPAAFPD